jgi:hypothetical protein
MVELLTSDSKFEGSEPATAGSGWEKIAKSINWASQQW